MGGYAVFVRGRVEPVAWFSDPDNAYIWAREHYQGSYKVNYMYLVQHA